MTKIDNHKGLLLCAKYSVAPNFFGYCGPDKNTNLVDHLTSDIGDREVKEILSEFESLHLNLNLIANQNKIKDPFDYRVVEAYWIGNRLLSNIKNKDYVGLLGEKFLLHKKIGDEAFGKMKHKFLSFKLLPHHSFHVFNIFKRTGHIVADHTIETMDNCRVGWGRIIKLSMINNQLSISVKTKQLTISNQHLTMSKEVIKELKNDYKGKSFLKNLRVGDWISFHWGRVCDVLTQQQVKNLDFYTRRAIDFYNSPV